MRAWLLTWEYYGSHARPTEPIAGILNPRLGARSVVRLVEFLYARATSSLAEMADYARSRQNMPYKATDTVGIYGVPHGERIFCGHNPWLYARKVSDLEVTVDEQADLETLEWTEPPTFRWKIEHRELDTVIAGERKRLARCRGPVSRDFTRDG